MVRNLDHWWALLSTWLTCCGEIVQSLGQNSRGKYPCFWRYLNFLVTQCAIGGRKCSCQKQARSLQLCLYNSGQWWRQRGCIRFFWYCTMFGILLQPEAIFWLMFPQTLNGIYGFSFPILPFQSMGRWRRKGRDRTKGKEKRDHPPPPIPGSATVTSLWQMDRLTHNDSIFHASAVLCCKNIQFLFCTYTVFQLKWCHNFYPFKCDITPCKRVQF